MTEDLDDKIKNLDGRENFLQQDSEMKQVFSNLDNDSTDSTGMSKVDFNARLNDSEIDASIIMDELIRMGILPKTLTLTRTKKRLSISKNGLGREEKVRLVAGDRENKAGSTFGNRLKNLFTPQQ